MRKKKFDAQAIDNAASFLKDKGFIDDNCFARAWINSRIKKPLGIRRLRQELALKGVDKTIIDNQINQIKKDYPEEEVVKNIVKDRLDKLKGYDPQKSKKRIFAYLLRRGFSPETVIDALNSYT